VEDVNANVRALLLRIGHYDSLLAVAGTGISGISEHRQKAK
jgi:hypothetical protein